MEPDQLQALCALQQRVVAGEASPEEAARARREVDQLFAEEHERLLWACQRLTGNAEKASDLAQETCLTAYGKLHEFRAEGSFHGWLYGIARFKWMREHAKKRDLLAEDGVLEAMDPASGALRGLREQEREELLVAASRAVLDEQEQEAVYLRYVENVDVDRITELLDISDKSGARGLLQRCRRKLGRELQRRLEELGHGTSLIFGSIVE